MMARKLENATDFTVAASGTDSNSLNHEADLNFADGLSIQAPATLTSASVTVQVSQDGSTWAALQSGGSDVTFGAGEVLVVTDVYFNYVRLKTASSEAAERTFNVTFGYNISPPRVAY
jgi:hypothetical protein